MKDKSIKWRKNLWDVLWLGMWMLCAFNAWREHRWVAVSFFGGACILWLVIEITARVVNHRHSVIVSGQAMDNVIKQMADDMEKRRFLIQESLRIGREAKTDNA